MQFQLKDKLNRSFDYLRISITDKCNFRCKYCMPKENFGSDYQFLKRDSLLTYEEIIRTVQILEMVGLKKIRLTGGEPLLRKNLENLVNGIKSNSSIEKISMTTNGSLFDKNMAKKLKDNGLDEVTISLDSMHKETLKNHHFISPWTTLQDGFGKEAKHYHTAVERLIKKIMSKYGVK